MKVQAEVYRLGLLSGYFANDNVINWADQVIAEEEKPDIEIIDVAFGKHLKSIDLARLLENVKGEIEAELPFKILLGLYSKELKEKTKTPSEVAKSVYFALNSITTTKPSSKEEQLIYYFDDRFDLAIAGVYGNLQDLENELRDFLSQYEIFADVVLNNHQEAKEVN